GRDVMTLQVANGVRQKLVAFKLTAKAPPPRPGYAIWNVDSTPAKIGQVVSGSQSPSLGIGIGMGYVTPDYARTGTTIAIEIRGNRVAAEIVPKPIYRSVT
ncbi:MAG: glycine cleavage system protein T, partial [Candidatus Omnitrophica bacterium]|nr:glycine cleavage system protein T [Candidatus Omnitrophota bacterium]